jgi:hypothetical protein
MPARQKGTSLTADNHFYSNRHFFAAIQLGNTPSGLSKRTEAHG